MAPEAEVGMRMPMWRQFLMMGRMRRVQAVAAPLTADIPRDVAASDLSADQRSQLLLASVLGWHRREQKPEWWAYFRQLELTPDEMIEAREPLGGLELIGVVFM